MNFRRLFKLLAHYAKPHYKLLYLILLSLVLVGVSVSMLGLVVKSFIDGGFASTDSLKINISKFVFFSLLLGCATGLRVFSVNYFSEKLCASIKETVYKKLLGFPIKRYDLDGSSQWTSFLTNDIDTAISSVSSNSSTIIRNLIMFIVAITLLLITSWKLSLVVLGVLPIILGIISFFGYKLRHKISEMKGIKSSLFLHFNETISLIKIVKIFNQEDYESKKLHNMNLRIILFGFSLFILRGFFLGLMISLMLLSIIIVIYFGGGFVIAGLMTAGTLSSFIFQSIIAASSVGGIIESFAEIGKNRPIFAKLADLLSEIEIQSSSLASLTLNNFDISIKNLYFTYPNSSDNVLKNINLDIKQGEKIAIIGSSGCGKSSLINLLLHFYDEYEGEIKLGGEEIRKISQIEYRKLISVVQQDLSIFSDTIYNNLVYGCTDYNEKDIWNILEKLNLSDFIKFLPNGLRTMIGDKSIKISGGQKQRLAIARALLKKPKILILDEATSALDNQNEQEIYNILLADAYKDLTVIFITHRLFNIQKMDKIVMMNNGIITDSGSHNSLLSENEQYKNILSEFY